MAKLLAKSLPSGDAEAGIHVHALERENGRTKTDGAHSHIFMLPTGEVILTEEDGEHEHKFSTGHEADGFDARIGWDGEHFHKITLTDGTELETEFESSGHSHETQVASTAFDGVHVHKLKLAGGQVITSMLPGQFWAATGKPNQAGNPPAEPASVLAKNVGDALGALESFKLTTGVVSYSDGGIYVQGGPEVRKAIEAAIGRMIPPEIAQTLKVIEGVPTHDYAEVADLCVNIRPEFILKAAGKKKPYKAEKKIVLRDGEYCAVSEDGEKSFGCFPTRAEAAERLGQVESFKAEGGVPGVLTWKSVLTGVMPPEGQSFLPPKIEALIPDRFQYWKLAGDEARKTRDALYDSGFVSRDSVQTIDDEPHLVTTKRFLLESDHVDQFAKPEETSFAGEVAELTQKVCVLWTDEKFPAALEFTEEHQSSVVVFDPSHSSEWIKSEGARAVVKRLSSLSCKFLFGCPDSIGARHAFAKAFSPFIVKRSALAGTLFATNLDIASPHVEIVGDGQVEFERQRDFVLAKQKWDDHELWHLTIGDDRWVLQGDPLSGSEVTAIRGGTAKAVAELETIDTGRAVYIDESVDVKKLRFDGSELDGVCEFARVSDPVWKFRAEVDAPPAELSKRYDIREFMIKAEDERFVLGVVLEPDGVDAQDDTISEKEIAKTAHKFMERFQNIGLMHEELAMGVRILESYLAPVEFEVDDRTVKKGTWLLAVRVHSDKIWKAIKEGTFTGFSIGGSAIRDPA